VERGCAYPCFCRDDELEARRRAARAEGRAPHYDGRCRGLSPEARERRAAAGEPRALRFKVPGRAVVVDDVVRGEVAFGPDAAGDFVLLRANGDPTYNFACVVDDAEMGITQVLRGEDHLPNTLRQILLYGALGLAPPRFWHLPLILGPDRSKLSKRHGDFDLRRYRERGYLPRTLLNHLALLGWSAPDGREVFSPEDLVAAFDPARISRSPAVFDPARLDWIGVQQMKAAPLAEVAAAARPFVAAAGVPWEGATLERGVALLREGMSCGQDFARELPAFRPGPVAIDPALRPWVAGRERKERLAGLAGRLAALDPWQAGAISATIRELVREAGLAARELFMPVRVAATGAAEGPALPETLELLGREETVRRLRAAVEEAG
jgi:glutamyl-tRNA synthetase